MIDKTKTYLALDPSFTATGWVLLHNGKVFKHGCHKLTKNEGISITEAKHLKQLQYAIFLSGLLNSYKPDVVFSEYPHGGQDANSAWSFGVTTSIITALCYAHNIPCKFVIESHVKKCLFGRSKNVEKVETRKKILALYAENGYIEDKAKYKAEAVADALAVYTYFTLNEGF